jgi:hypothetical protein
MKLQLAPAEPFPYRPPRFRRHRRQGIDGKFFDLWSRNGVRGDRSCDDAFPSAKVLKAPCSHATEPLRPADLQDVGDLARGVRGDVDPAAFEQAQERTVRVMS